MANEAGHGSAAISVVSPYLNQMPQKQQKERTDQYRIAGAQLARVAAGLPELLDLQTQHRRAMSLIPADLPQTACRTAKRRECFDHDASRYE
jgi:hypothetical protein